MSNKLRFIVSLTTAVTVLCGCESALLNMRDENRLAEQRISQKERDLRDIEAQQTALEQEKTQLLATLDNSRGEVDRVSEQLTRLREENARLTTENAAQKRKQKEVETRLKSYQERINATETNSSLDTEQKQKRIDELKNEIRTYLELGLR